MAGIKRFLTILIAGIFLLNASSAFCDSGKVIAYYFHGSFRCPTCRNLEGYAKEAIENNFKKELAKGNLIFKVVILPTSMWPPTIFLIFYFSNLSTGLCNQSR